MSAHSVVGGCTQTGEGGSTEKISSSPLKSPLKSPVHLQGIHHVAYRCLDAKTTVQFYQKYLNMDFLLAIAEDEVPSTKEPDPYMHIFLDAGQGNVLAFFELPQSPPMPKDPQSRDPSTPEWVQHIAFAVSGVDVLEQTKLLLEADGIEVLGPTDHTIFSSIYFFDPNGHRIELATNTDKPGMLTELKRLAPEMLEEWSNTKKAPKHAQWLHGVGEFISPVFNGEQSEDNGGQE